MIMRLNNESFEAMYCRTENDLTQRISIDKNLLFCTFLQKDVRESTTFFISAEKLRVR